MNDETITLSRGDLDLVWKLSGVKPCSLERSPGKNDNWVESGGGLPPYICEIAKGVHRTGKSISASIAIAVSRVKKWAAGGDNVDADTRAKAAKAVAQWASLRARTAAKKVVKATAPDGTDFVILSSVTSYSLDQVRDAWDSYMRNIRTQIRAAEEARSEITQKEHTVPDSLPYGYVREVYVDYVIVSFEDTVEAFYRVPYSVGEGGVVFGNPEPIKLMWQSESGDWRAQARR